MTEETKEGKNDAHEYDRQEIQDMLFQTDNLFHNRVGSLLVAESFLLAAAATVWGKIEMVIPFCMVGLGVTILFWFIGLKLYRRMRWLIGRMKRSPFYEEFLRLASVDGDDTPLVGPVTTWVLSCLPLQQQRSVSLQTPNCLDSGWLLSWGLSILLGTCWAWMIIASFIWRCTC